jgi:tubulin--tyrosine ligase-like protein 12
LAYEPPFDAMELH